MAERPELVTEAEWLQIGASAAVDELKAMAAEAKWHIEAGHVEDAQLELQKAGEWLTYCRRQVDRWALQSAEIAVHEFDADPEAVEAAIRHATGSGHQQRSEIAAEPTDEDYVQGRARMTAVSEWAKTGRRLEWADNTVSDRDGS